VLKVTEQTDGIKSYVESTLIEINAMKLLNHPHILGIEDAFLNDYNLICIVTLPSIEGDLASVLIRRKREERPFTPDEMLDLVKQLLSGLKHMKDKGVCH
jgi:serine/threonine protein kinase